MPLYLQERPVAMLLKPDVVDDRPRCHARYSVIYKFSRAHTSPPQVGGVGECQPTESNCRCPKCNPRWQVVSHSQWLVVPRATSATFDNVRRRSHVCHRVVGEPKPPRLQCILSRCDAKHTFIAVVVRTEVEVNPKLLEQSVQAPGFATIGLW